MSHKRKYTQSISEKNSLKIDIASNPELFEFKKIFAPKIPEACMKTIHKKDPDTGELTKIDGFLYCGHKNCERKPLNLKVSGPYDTLRNHLFYDERNRKLSSR